MDYHRRATRTTVKTHRCTVANELEPPSWLDLRGPCLVGACRVGDPAW